MSDLSPRIVFAESPEGPQAQLLGRWGAAELGERRHARALLRQLAQQTPQAQLGWDLSAVQWLDHVGAQLLWRHWGHAWPQQLTATPAQRAMLERVAQLSQAEPASAPPWSLVAALIHLGELVNHARTHLVFGTTLKIHYEPAMAGEQRIIEYIGQHIAPDYGLKLEAVGVQDPVQADRAVAEGQYAGTIYQHQWWLKQVVDANGFALSTTVPVFQWAFGIYSDRYSSVQALPNGATIVVPDDGANQGQALWLLQRIGLISLDPAVEPRTAKLKNIVGNPHQFVFKELDLLTMPRALNSVDAAIGYVSQFDAGKVPREKGILFPPAPRTFASQLVIGTPYLSQENIVKLKQAFSDPRIQTWLKTTDDPLVKDVLVPVSAE